MGSLVEAFRKVKDIDHPVVVHIHTEKGHGYAPAVADKERWHWSMPFHLEDGSPLNPSHGGKSMDMLLGDWLFEEMQRDKKLVAITAVGDFFQKGEAVRQLLAEKGIDATLINPRYLSGLDEQLLDELKADHTVVATIEDGSIDGGYGETVARFYGPSAMRVLNFGVRKMLYDRYDVDQLLTDNHLQDQQIADDIMQVVNSIK